MNKKVAIIFPGIGYHSDKPLLYYAKKQARELGYSIIEVNYDGFEKDIKGNPDKMIGAFEHGLNQAREILKEYNIEESDDLLFISKSIGTVIAAAWQRENNMIGKNIYFTPVDQSFEMIMPESGIVFHGTNDGWANTIRVRKACEQMNLPLHEIALADHSLETLNSTSDLLNLTNIFTKTSGYILGIL